MVAANTLLEYLLAASTVAKGFASYFTVLIGELISFRLQLSLGAGMHSRK